MRKSRKVLWAIALSLVVLAAGAGIAVAQSPGDEALPADGAQNIGPQGMMGPGGFGPEGGRRIPMMGGEVVGVNGDTITLKTFRDEEKTVKVNAETVYRKKDGDATLADVVVGERIGIRLTGPVEEGQELVAKAVMIGLPERPHMQPAVGEVTAVDGNTVTINTQDGEKQFTIPSIETGSRLGVIADEDGNVKGVLYDPPERPEGAPEDEAPPAEE